MILRHDISQAADRDFTAYAVVIFGIDETRTVRSTDLSTKAFVQLFVDGRRMIQGPVWAFDVRLRIPIVINKGAIVCAVFQWAAESTETFDGLSVGLLELSDTLVFMEMRRAKLDAANLLAFDPMI